MYYHDRIIRPRRRAPDGVRYYRVPLTYFIRAILYGFLTPPFSKHVASSFLLMLVYAMSPKFVWLLDQMAEPSNRVWGTVRFTQCSELPLDCIRAISDLRRSIGLGLVASRCAGVRLVVNISFPRVIMELQ